MTTNKKIVASIVMALAVIVGIVLGKNYGFGSIPVVITGLIALVMAALLAYGTIKTYRLRRTRNNLILAVIAGVLAFAIACTTIASVVVRATGHVATETNVADDNGAESTLQTPGNGGTGVDADDIMDGDKFTDGSGHTFESQGDATGNSDFIDGIASDDAEQGNLQDAISQMGWRVDLSEKAVEERFGDTLNNRKFYPFSMPNYAEKRRTIVKGNDGVSIKFKSYDKNNVDPVAIFDEYCNEVLHNFTAGYEAVTALVSRDFIAEENPELVAIKRWMTKEYEKAKAFAKKYPVIEYPDKKNPHGNNAFIVKNPDREGQGGYKELDVSGKYTIAAARIVMTLETLYTPEVVKTVSSKDYVLHLVDTADPVLVRTKQSDTPTTKLSLVLRRRYMDDADGKVVDKFAIRICDKGIMDINPVVRVAKQAIKKVNNKPVQPSPSNPSPSNPEPNPPSGGGGNGGSTSSDPEPQPDKDGDSAGTEQEPENKNKGKGDSASTEQKPTNNADKNNTGQSAGTKQQGTNNNDKKQGDSAGTKQQGTNNADKNNTGQSAGTKSDPVNKADKQKPQDTTNPKQEGNKNSEGNTDNNLNVGGIKESDDQTAGKAEEPNQAIKEEAEIPANNQVDKTQNEQAANSNGTNNAIKEQIQYTDSSGNTKNDQKTTEQAKPADGKPLDSSQTDNINVTDNKTGKTEDASHQDFSGNVGEDAP